MYYKLKKSRRRGRGGRISRTGRTGRSRSGRISRRMRMKGGLGPNDSVNIGLRGTYSFAGEQKKELQQDLKMFTFGTQSQYDAWNTLLVACRGRGVPVYILTSGNKVGIIRTLQLMGMDGEFVEVLCTNEDREINPANSEQHNFHKQHKYAVIQQIMTERGLDCQGRPIGYLMDDGVHNSDQEPALCPAIQFMHVFSNQRKPSEYDEAALLQNIFYKVNTEKLDLERIDGANARFNFTPIENITKVTEEVNAGQIEILFVDFDQTFQIWEGAIQLENPVVLRIFGRKGVNIITD